MNMYNDFECLDQLEQNASGVLIGNVFLKLMFIWKTGNKTFLIQAKGSGKGHNKTEELHMNF